MLGTLLGLTRPYDVVLLAGIRAAVLALTEPPRRWPRKAAPLALLLPVAGYLWWVFYRVPAFAGLAAIGYARPPFEDFALALGPAALVAAGAWAARRWWRRAQPMPVSPPTDARRTALVDLSAWLAIAGAVMAVSPVNFSLQFLVGIGVPCSRSPPSRSPRCRWRRRGRDAGPGRHRRRRAGPRPRPKSRVARPRRAYRRRARAPRELPARGRGAVAAGHRHYAAAFTACTPIVSHAGAPGHADRAAAVRRFYEEPDPAFGASLAARYCVAHLVLPAAAAIERHLDDAASYRAVAVMGEGPRAIAVYSRAVPPACGGR